METHGALAGAVQRDSGREADSDLWLRWDNRTEASISVLGLQPPQRKASMLGTTTPDKITEAIIKLCAGIDPTQKPVFLTLQPDPKAILSECFTNVREHVKAHGGTLQLGWIIWETPDILLEGMFHAVWSSAEGKLVDVTPQMDGERQILFLPDSGATIQRETGNVVGMRRMALVNDPLVHEYIRLGDLKDAVKVRTQGRLTMRDVTEIGEIERQLIPVQQKLALKYRGNVGEVRVAPLSFRPSGSPAFVEGVERRVQKVGRNHPCPCRSGKKHKKCCGA